MMIHENQRTQPMPEGEERDLTYCYINYLSMLAADKLLFTTEFHLNDLLEALPEFLNRFPDDKHYNPVDQIREKSIVIPPGLDLAVFDRSEEHTSELQSRGHLVCRLLLEKKNSRE